LILCTFHTQAGMSGNCGNGLSLVCSTDFPLPLPNALSGNVAEQLWRNDMVHRIPRLAAIRQGFGDAIWQVDTNATDAPCADLYAAIENGVATAAERTATPIMALRTEQE
jgi:hypothetical protein